MKGHIDLSGNPLDRVDQPEEWLPVAPEAARLAMPVAGRSDLVVTIGPGVTMGPPAVFIPSRAEIRLDTGQLLPARTTPGTVDLSDELFRLEHAEFVGATIHEASHAAHTRWLAPTLLDLGATPRQVDIAIVLEESRIEGLAVKRKPRTRPFLRASATGLILKDFELGTTVYGAAASAGLLLARADAGVLDQDDVTTVEAAVRNILGYDKLASLRTLWQSYLELGDRDTDGVLTITSRWLQTLGPEAEDAPMAAVALSSPGAGDPQRDGGAVPLPDWLARGAGQVAIAADTAVSRKRRTERTRRDREAAEGDADRRSTGAAARRTVYAPPVDGMESQGVHVSSRTPHRRSPTREERSAATALASSLIMIRSAEGDLVSDYRPNPPGRLNTRALVRTIASGPDAAPEDMLFRHSATVPGPDDRLTVALMVDISGSMHTAAEPMASAQWVLSRAASAIGARVAVVHYGVQAYGVQRVGELPATVDVYECGDGFESFKDAFLAVDAEAELLDSPGARLLVIASDARYGRPGEAEYAQRAMSMCKHHGVAVFWLDATGSFRTRYGHGTVVNIRRMDPVAVARRIGEAVMELADPDRSIK